MQFIVIEIRFSQSKNVLLLKKRNKPYVMNGSGDAKKYMNAINILIRFTLIKFLILSKETK